MRLKKKTINYLVVAPMGDYMDALYIGLREFPTEKVILLSPDNRKNEAEKAKLDLDNFRIPTQVISIKGVTEIEIWESTFKVIGDITSGQMNNSILVNVGTGDSITRCAATTAAFVNGLRAFAIYNDKVMMLPFMKFSYYKLIHDKKMEILRIFSDKTCCSSLEEISMRTGMSLPLISYHINGNLKSEGLKDMGLVETKEERNKIEIELSTLGRMVIAGYIKN